VAPHHIQQKLFARPGDAARRSPCKAPSLFAKRLLPSRHGRLEEARRWRRVPHTRICWRPAHGLYSLSRVPCQPAAAATVWPSTTRRPLGTREREGALPPATQLCAAAGARRRFFFFYFVFFFFFIFSLFFIFFFLFSFLFFLSYNFFFLLISFFFFFSPRFFFFFSFFFFFFFSFFFVFIYRSPSTFIKHVAQSAARGMQSGGRLRQPWRRVPAARYYGRCVFRVWVHRVIMTYRLFPVVRSTHRMRMCADARATTRIVCVRPFEALRSGFLK